MTRRLGGFRVTGVRPRRRADTFGLAFGSVLLAALAFLAIAPAVIASTTIGQLAPPNPPAACLGGPNDLLQASLTSGNPYTVPPEGGTITSWSTNAAPGPGQTLKMKVFRLVSGTTYTVVAHDGPRALTPSTLNTFSGLSIPVQGGDVVGLNDQNAPAAHNACLFTASSSGDIFGASPMGDVADGTSETIGPVAGGYRLNVTAVVGSTPSDVFTFDKVKYNKNKGTATLAVNVPGPGTLSLTGKGVKAQRPASEAVASKAVSAAGTVKLPIKAKGKAKGKLNKRGKLKAKVKVTYTPTGDLPGVPNTQSKRVKLVKKH